jgi:hypothetical protein|nr:MAG TPA_asm: hypothetical protein [Caudoviricetes sp.]
MGKKMIDQIVENEKVNAILNELDNTPYSRTVANQTLDRLYTCQAWTYEVGNFAVLISHNTEVACIDMRTGICYDYLRKAYGYTATSAQYISKFMKKFEATQKVTYRPI